MANFFNIFKTATTQENSSPSRDKMAPGTRICHDPHLVDKLKDDHANLLELWGAIDKALKKGDVKGMGILLSRFKTALNNHLLVENVKLYVYLTQYLANDPDNAEIIKDFRTEMNSIGRTVTTFLRTYTVSPIKPEQLMEFKTQFDAIGAALVDRIEREESTLYQLYIQV